MLSSAAMMRRFVALSFQFALKADRSLRFSTMSGCWSKAARALASSFLEETARITPAPGQCGRIGLEAREGLAQRTALADDDASQPVIADHAAPERIVQVKHQAFGRATLRGRQQARHQVAVQARGERRHLLFGAVPEHRIMPSVHPVFGRAGVQGQEVDAVLARGLPQLQVQSQSHGARRPGQAILVQPQQVGEQRQRGLLDDLAAETLPSQPPQLPQLAHGGVDLHCGVPPHSCRDRRGAAGDRRRWPAVRR